ncbi:MAG: MtrB/PioB family decaheme-associated outer membrane protein, partial [Gammaproteobacteria bacterium]|nr:MtrB/PioB family decaheme-associated outer membrane protein [Gammaproteobacteria bacterium]
FNPLVPGATSGLAARPPDNDFQQLSLTGNYRSASDVTLVGNIAVGKASQDELLAAYTVNELLPTVALPASSADGRIDSTHLNGAAMLSGRLSRNLRYKAFYRKHERDNQTPARDWQPVVMDIFQDGTRRNTPFSFDKTEYGLNLRFRLKNAVRMSAGIEREDYQRDFQEVRETNENSYWVKLTAHSGDDATITFNARRDYRDGSGYRPVSSLSPPQNPLLRKYNMADRDRSLLSATLSVNPTDSVSLSLLGEYANDDYPDSVIGLKESEDRSVTLDASLQPRTWLGIHAFLTRQSLEYSQAGFANGPWAATGEDRFITSGLNLDFRGDDSGRHLRINYTRTDSRGTSFIDAGSGSQAFPDLSADLEVFSAAFTGVVRDKLRARISYQYERYHSRDWQIEGVTPTTIGNVLAFGEALPNYTQQIIWLGLVRDF